MTNAAEITQDPVWLPLRYDAGGDRVLFVRLDRDSRRDHTFLADYRPGENDVKQWVAGADIRAAKIEAAPIHFIFHSAFCRSTLLVKAFEIPGRSAGFSEPGILNDLAAACAQGGGQKMIGPIVDLLARPWGPGETVIVKPSNVANQLLPLILAERPAIRAVILSSRLPKFLDSIARKGLEGRIWSRRLYLHNNDYISLDLGLDSRQMYELSDLQVAALAWLLHRRHFAMALASPAGERMRTLDADTFNSARDETIAATAGFFDIALSDEQVHAIAAGPVFERHSKYGTDFAETVATEAAAAVSTVTEAEIGYVAQWIDQIVAGFRLSMPESNSLLSARAG